MLIPIETSDCVLIIKKEISVLTKSRKKREITETTKREWRVGVKSTKADGTSYGSERARFDCACVCVRVCACVCACGGSPARATDR